MIDGTYQATIMDWGLKYFTENDEYKVFVKFELKDTPKEMTWHGSIDDTAKTSKAGKPYTMLGITKGKLKSLGYKYDSDLEAIVTMPDPFPQGELITLSVKSFDKDGKSIQYIEDFWTGDKPKARESSFSKVVEGSDAASILRKVSTKTIMQKAANDSTDSDMPF